MVTNTITHFINIKMLLFLKCIAIQWGYKNNYSTTVTTIDTLHTI